MRAGGSKPTSESRHAHRPGRRSRPWIAVLLVLACSHALGHDVGADENTPAEQVWIELRAPAVGEVRTLPIPLLEVRGAAGAGRVREYDLAVVVDLSSSTRLPSGVDVDQDGALGRSAPWIRRDYWGTGAPQELCDDPGDTIASAEIEAVRRLLGLLNPRRTRVALVAFGDRAKRVASLGSSRSELEDALDRLDRAQGSYGATHYAAAVEEALRALPEASERRFQSVLLLSDGAPTLPVPEPAPKLRSIEAAGQAASRGIRLFTFALGPDALPGRETLDAMSRSTGGDMVVLERPGDVLFDLPYVELSEIRTIELRNTTTGEPGRAVRRFADGSFDGFVSLVPGRNQIRVDVTTASGERTASERQIEYAPREPAANDRSLELEQARIRRLLRDRTVEVELAAEMRRARRERTRTLRIEATSEPPRDPKTPTSAQ